MNILKSIRGRYWVLKKKIRMKFGGLTLKYRLADLNKENYDKAKHSGDDGGEHEIGRLINFKNIINEISAKKLRGDIVEFGTWQGFSLLWIAYLCEHAGLFDKKIIGIDGFVGLPYEDGGFRIGQFWDASLKMTQKNVCNNKNLSQEIRKNISVFQALFSQKELILSTIGPKKFVFLHIDCDVSKSAVEIFEILTEGDMLADTCFMLFDDYGCDTNLKHEVDAFMATLRQTYSIQEHSSTRYTKNFMLEKMRR